MPPPVTVPLGADWVLPLAPAVLGGGGVVVGGVVVVGGSFARCCRSASSVLLASTSVFCLARTSLCASCTAARACWQAEICWLVGAVFGSFPIAAHMVVAVWCALSSVAIATSTACCALITAC